MKLRFSIWTILVLIVGIVPAVAQTLSCPLLVEQALTAVGDNCGDLSRNSACYGYNQVDATFFDDMPEDYFTIPSDRANLQDIDMLHTQPLDTSQSQWGVAIMNIQANLPNTVPGQGVLMMLVGDATVENDVDPDEANLIKDPLSTVATLESNLHLSPSQTSEVVDIVAENSIVLVDGFNATRTWLRVVNDGVIAWIPSDNVARLAAMDGLPIVGANNPTAMQAFYLSSGIGEVACSEADSMIAVQSPENITVDLTVNGVDIKVGSLITFNNLDEKTINLTVHRGEVTTVFGNTVSAGQSAIGVINSAPEQGDVIVAWGEAVPATEEELALGERAQTGLNSVARNNDWDEREIEPPSDQPEQPTTSSGEIIHIVSSGETLFGIGRLYDTSLVQIVNRNNLSEPYTLFSGDELVIPNPGSGFVGLPSSGNDEPVSQPPSSDEPASTGTCDALRLTSPLQSAPTEATPYYWDGVAGATQYQINIYDAATGMLMGTFYTDGAETSITIGAGQIGVGGMLQWEVIALVNGEPLCGTGRSQPMPHNAPIDPVIPTVKEEDAPFKISWECVTGNLIVSWKNAESDDDIDITITDAFGSFYYHDGSGEEGSITQGYTGYNYTSATAETSSGEEASVTGNMFC